MPDTTNDFQPLPESRVHSDVAGILAPGEQVIWQEKPRGKSPWFQIAIVLAITAALFWQEGLLEDPASLLRGAPLSTLIVLALFPVGLIGGFIAVQRYRRHAIVYALTSERVLRVFRGRVAQEATPRKLQLRGSPSRRRVRWHNVDFPPDTEIKGRYGFADVQDGRAVYRLLDAWQKRQLRKKDEGAEVSSEAFRRRSQGTGAGSESPDDARTEGTAESDSAHGAVSASTQRIDNSEYGFGLDVPSQWDVQIGQQYDGPLQIFGVTVLKRVLRPAHVRPYQQGGDLRWNLMQLRGGPSTGLNIKVNPGRMYDEAEVLNDRWGKRLGIEVKFVERDIDIAGFCGFAVVRELPAGSSPMGFGTLPLAVISRQWWLRGHGLNLEIQGIAPGDSTTLQDTIDLCVGSLSVKGRGG